MAGCVNAVPAFVCIELPASRGKQFLWFLKIDLLRFHRTYLLYDWSKLLFFAMCLLRINLPNLCPNMIRVDALDFSGGHSKEVISFFWRSVYFPTHVNIDRFHWFTGLYSGASLHSHVVMILMKPKDKFQNVKGCLVSVSEANHANGMKPFKRMPSIFVVSKLLSMINIIVAD